ncbi:MAG: single-stranded DNA-binding protein [Planctomycetes bacterium]|nr:single-stranded DNA-binding protein [Planctomycetota bacterium]
MTHFTAALLRSVNELSRAVDALEFAPPTTHVYNPLDYARAPLELYLKRYARRGVKGLLLGMNPGPYGMAQTGVPFGEVAIVRDWLGLEAPVARPANEHPKRPIEGFACTRSEVSGQRLWGLARERCPTPGAFFEQLFVWNYCPLVFMEASAKNRTPDKLPKADCDALYAVCDEALRRFVALLEPQLVIGVGKFAEDRARTALGPSGPRIGTILHPSPASPVANRGWAPQAEKQLRALGIELDIR